MVPHLVLVVLYTGVLVCALLSLPAIGSYGPAPTTLLLDLWILLASVSAWARVRFYIDGLTALVAVLGVVVLLCSSISGPPWVELIQAYRWLFYLFAFLVFSRVRADYGRGLIWFTKALVLLALTKAVATLAVLGPGERPGLLVENNFELAMFIGLSAVVFPRMERHRFALIAALGALTVMATSRSGAVVFAIFAIYALSQIRIASRLRQLVLMIGTPFLVLVPVWIFSVREQVGVRIDRVTFMNVFLQEADSWNVLNWMFGTFPLTPLSSAGCARLAYYQDLFSSAGDGQCFSVILHAYILRVLFDAGILGLLFAFFMTWLAMRRAGMPVSQASTLIAIALANSASVSGLSSPYVAVPIAIALLGAVPPGWCDPADVSTGIGKKSAATRQSRGAFVS